MSKTACFYPIVGALQGALNYLSAKDWNTVNDTQRDFLAKFYGDATSETPSMKELETRASKVAAELNNFLQERGFTIKLDDFNDNEFGVVSILDVLVEWLDTGKRRKLYPVKDDGTVTKEPYDAVYLDDNFQVFVSPNHNQPIARLDTKKEGEYVFLTKHPQSIENLDLMTVVKNLESSLEPDNKTYWDAVMFPMVDLNQEVDIDWLKSMFTLVGMDKWEIAKALQQTKFRMNEVGARAESAVALQMRCASAMRHDPTLKIDGPFLVWMSRKGLSMPFFAGHITEEDWKDPKTLSSKHDKK